MNRFNTLLLASASALALALAASRAGATQYFFTGNGSSANWSDSANWSPAGPPPGGDVDLAQSGAHPPSNFDISGTFASLTLDTPSAPATQASGYIINGGGVFTFINNGVFVDNAANAAADQLNMNFVLQGATVIAGSTARGLDLGGIVSGGGGITVNPGLSALLLGGANTYSGGTTIDSGSTVVQGVGTVGTPGAITSSAFGTGTLTFDGGTLQGGGNFTVANAIAINSTGGAINSAGAFITFSGVVADGSGTPAGALNVSDSVGGGVVLLSGANTYSGGTIIGNGAELRQGVDTVGTPGAITSSAFGTGTLTFNGGALETTGDFTVANAGQILVGGGAINAVGHNLTYSGVISSIASPGDLTIESGGGAGIVTFTATNTYTGGTAVLSNSTLALSGAGSIASSSGVHMEGGTFDISGASSGESINLLYGSGTVALGSKTLTVTAGNLASTDEFDGVIQDGGLAGGTGGSFTLAAGGEYFTANNTYTGTTTIASGATLVLGGANGSFGSGPVINNGSLIYFRSNPSTLGTAVSGSGSLTVETGTVTVTAAQIYTGATIVFGGFSGGPGVMALSGTGAIVDSSSISVGQNATFDISQTYDLVHATPRTVSIKSLSGSGTVALGAGILNITAGADTFSGVMQDGGILGVTDANLEISGGTETLSGANIYTGFTIIDAGATLALSGNGNMIYSGSVRGDGTFDISQTTSGALIHSLGSSGIVALGGKTLTIGYAFGETFSGSIQDGGIAGGGGGNVILGSGTETFSGVNSFTGATTIDSGSTLILSRADSIAASKGVDDEGGFDISAAGASIKSLSGAGTVSMGSQVLIITAAAGTFFGQIGGSGPVTIAGGTEVFASNQSYSGSTTVNNGAILQLGNGGTAGSVGSSIFVDDGTVVIDRSDNATAPHLIGNGGLTQAGSGQLTISTSEGYGGITTISAGTLALSGAGGFSIGAGSQILDNANFDISGISGANSSIPALTGTGTVNLGTKTLTILGAGAFSGVIGGTGGVTLSASGINSFSGVNTYTGPTTIAAGDTLALAGSGSIAASSAVSDGGTGAGTLDISATSSGAAIKAINGNDNVVLGARTLTISAGSGSYAGVIGGTGGVTLSGGTETFAGANTYAGATSIGAAGTLALSGAGSVANSSGVADAGTFDISATAAGASVKALTGAGVVTLGSKTLTISAATGTFYGVIGGTGGVSLSGGTQIFTGANSYTSATTIGSGVTLQLGNGGTTGSVAGNIADNGALIFNRSDALTYAGVISGAGVLTQAGSGNLILSGTSSFTGTVNVVAGTLSVNGTLPASISVPSGGKLGGSGTVGAVTVASGGTLAPGNSIGTVHVSGNLTLSSGSTYAVEVSPAAADETIVTGAAGLAGTLALSPAAGTYTAGTDYVLISAGSITGTFGSVTGMTFPGLNPTVVYSATKVDLVLNPVTYMFASYGTTANQVAVGQAVSAGSATGALYVALGNLVGGPAISGALGQLSGEIHASLRSAAVEDSRVIRDTVLAHVARAGEGMNVWLRGWGAAGSIAESSNANKLNHNSSGVIGGIDMPLGGGLRLGVAGAYDVRSTNAHDLSAHATGNSGHLIGYADWTGDPYELSLGGDLAWGTDHVMRQISAFSESDSDRQTSRSSQLFADAGYKIPTAGALLEPHATLAWIVVGTGGFAESGGPGALSGASKSNAATYSLLGLRAALDSWDLNGAALTPRLDLGWQHAFNPLTPSQALTIISTGQSFMVDGVPLGADSASVQLGLGLALSPSAELSLEYDGNFSSHVEEHALEAGLTVTF